MSFPRYPKYKDSCVEWLGHLPENWELTPVWLLFGIGRGRVISHEEIADNPGTFPVYSSQMEANGVMGTIASYDFDGDYITWTTDGANAGTVFRRTGRFNCTNVCGTLKPYNSRVVLDYATHALAVSTMAFVRHDINPKLMNNVMAKIRIPIPSTTEQTAIATFLDGETAKIDALVAEQQRLIDLLKEKRQAVISHAVTKGLDPSATMKPSGIDWLGLVPEHWDVLPIKRIVAVPITDGPHETPQFLDDGVPFVSAEAVATGCIDFTKVRACISHEDNARYSEKYAPRRHDIYMVKSGATTGVTAIVDSRTDFNIWSPLAAIRCGEKAAPYFILNFMRSRNFMEAVSLNWSFGTQQNIGMGVIENLSCPLPPLFEQTAIASFLDGELSKFDSLISESGRAIDLLQERRTALISAAVTGQIDVRGTAPEGPTARPHSSPGHRPGTSPVDESKALKGRPTTASLQL